MEVCPLPDVQAALAPFVKPRKDVDNIRRSLQTYIHEELLRNDSSLTVVNLANLGTTVGKTAPKHLTGVHHAYWKALEAHSAAQANCEALKADLQRLKRGDHSSSERSEPSQLQDYLLLVRQREKQRRLKVIDHTLSKINSTEGYRVSTTVDDIVKQEIGELPVPPSTQVPSFGGVNSSTEARIQALKKAVISSRRKVEELRARQSIDHADGSGVFSAPAQIAGLQKSLHELTAWMETQLGVIAEAQEDAQATAADASTRTTTDGSRHSPEAPVEQLDELYEDYLSARERLVELANSPPKPSATANKESDDLMNESKDPAETSAPKTPAEALLPHMSSLVQSRQAEQALVQQLAHIRHHVTSAESAADAAIRKLADESHLVPPGAGRGSDWYAAGVESCRATSDFLEKRIAAGETAAVSARTVLGDIQALPDTLDRAR